MAFSLGVFNLDWIDRLNAIKIKANEIYRVQFMKASRQK